MLTRPLLVVTALMVGGLMSASALSGEAGSDPYAELGAVAEDDLGALNGREGILMATQDQEAHSDGTVTTAGGDVEGGEIDLGSSFQQMRGVSNQVFTTGNQSTSQGQVTVNIHLQ